MIKRKDIKLFFFVIVLLLSLKNITAQNCITDTVIQLDSTLRESSGLIYFNGKFITHNDSGGQPELYEIDTLTGKISRIITISNASNVDWEDIAQDSNYIYIGDFGNNSGIRTDLKIYKIAKSDYINQNTVIADTINFRYADQLSFVPQPQNTNYDCEAMTVFGDSIFLFTKNWINKKTNLYVLPKTQGSYAINLRDSFDVQGTITGAVYNPYSHTIRLVGYNQITPFMWELYQFSGYSPFSGINTYCEIIKTGSMQIEAIAVKSEFEYYISAEKIVTPNIILPAYLSKYNDNTLGIEQERKLSITIYPNPITNQLNILFKRKYDKEVYIEIIDNMGRTIYSGKTNNEFHRIDVSFLKQGIYYLTIQTKKQIITKKITKFR